MTTWLPIPSTFPRLGLSHDTGTSREPVKGIPEDVVLISIDFENYEAFNPTSIDAVVCTQMGIAVLDSLSGAATMLSDSVHMRPPQFRPILLRRAPPSIFVTLLGNYLFGEMVVHKPSDFLAALYDLLPTNRPFIFIRQNIATERRVLRDMGFEPPPRLLGFFDTGKLGDDGPDKRDSLEKTVTRLACPYRNLHYAGNDAHFTLRAFLLLVERGFLKRHPELRLQDTNARILSAIKDIALAPLSEPAPFEPPPPGARRAANMDAREAVLR